MATVVSDQALGRIGTYAELTGNAVWVMVLLKQEGLRENAEFSSYTSLADVLAVNTEADFTNYGRKQFTVTQSLDAGTALAVDAANQIWTDAGGFLAGQVNNTIGKVVVCYDPDPATSTDADKVFLLGYDVIASTNGNDFTVRVHDYGLMQYHH